VCCYYLNIFSLSLYCSLLSFNDILSSFYSFWFPYYYISRNRNAYEMCSSRLYIDILIFSAFLSSTIRLNWKCLNLSATISPYKSVDIILLSPWLHLIISLIYNRIELASRVIAFNSAPCFTFSVFSISFFVLRTVRYNQFQTVSFHAGWCLFKLKIQYPGIIIIWWKRPKSNQRSAKILGNAKSKTTLHVIIFEPQGLRHHQTLALYIRI
jgi:hypothetical protein